MSGKRKLEKENEEIDSLLNGGARGSLFFRGSLVVSVDDVRGSRSAKSRDDSSGTHSEEQLYDEKAFTNVRDILSTVCAFQGSLQTQSTILKPCYANDRPPLKVRQIKPILGEYSEFSFLCFERMILLLQRKVYTEIKKVTEQYLKCDQVWKKWRGRIGQLVLFIESPRRLCREIATLKKILTNAFSKGGVSGLHGINSSLNSLEILFASKVYMSDWKISVEKAIKTLTVLYLKTLSQLRTLCLSYITYSCAGHPGNANEDTGKRSVHESEYSRLPLFSPFIHEYNAICEDFFNISDDFQSHFLRPNHIWTYLYISSTDIIKATAKARCLYQSLLCQSFAHLLSHINKKKVKLEAKQASAGKALRRIGSDHRASELSLHRFFSNMPEFHFDEQTDFLQSMKMVAAFYGEKFIDNLMRHLKDARLNQSMNSLKKSMLWNQGARDFLMQSVLVTSPDDTVAFILKNRLRKAFIEIHDYLIQKNNVDKTYLALDSIREDIVSFPNNSNTQLLYNILYFCSCKYPPSQTETERKIFIAESLGIQENFEMNSSWQWKSISIFLDNSLLSCEYEKSKSSISPVYSQKSGFSSFINVSAIEFQDKSARKGLDVFQNVAKVLSENPQEALFSWSEASFALLNELRVAMERAFNNATVSQHDLIIVSIHFNQLSQIVMFKINQILSKMNFGSKVTNSISMERVSKQLELSVPLLLKLFTTISVFENFNRMFVFHMILPQGMRGDEISAGKNKLLGCLIKAKECLFHWQKLRTLILCKWKSNCSLFIQAVYQSALKIQPSKDQRRRSSARQSVLLKVINIKGIKEAASAPEGLFPPVHVLVKYMLDPLKCITTDVLHSIIHWLEPTAKHKQFVSERSSYIGTVSNVDLEDISKATVESNITANVVSQFSMFTGSIFQQTLCVLFENMLKNRISLDKPSLEVLESTILSLQQIFNEFYEELNARFVAELLKKNNTEQENTSDRGSSDGVFPQMFAKPFQDVLESVKSQIGDAKRGSDIFAFEYWGELVREANILSQ
eukprot:Nk52_evm12s1992 gene=Nk52_evmTU12s1992